MRIAMVSEHASPLAAMGGEDAGGQNVHVDALARALAARGHEVTVHTRRYDADLPEAVTLAPGVTVHHIDAGPPRPIPKDALVAHLPTFSRVLTSRWSHDRPDVIHAHFWMSGLTSLRGADLLDIPLAVTFHALGSVKRRHQPQADTSADTRIPAERRLIRYADRVIATCSDEVDELLALGGDRRTIETIPCGVEPDRFRTGWRSNVTLPRRTAQHRLVCLSRLVPRKGVAEAIEMLAHLPDADLLVAGGPSVNTLDDDPEVQRLRGIADDLGVEHRVLFVGAVAREDVPAVMAQADVGVCLPWYEPFGIVPLEMMACQKPVVGTKVGGLLDTVVDGSTGLLVPPKSPHHAATAVRALLDDPVMRSEMGRKARERVEQSYDWRRVAEATESVYEQMVLEKLQGIRGLPVAGTAS